MKTSEIAKAAGVSKSYISKVRSGKIKAGDKIELISHLFDFEMHLREIIRDSRFWEMCEVAIEKSKSVEVRKFATRCQHTSEMLRRDYIKEVEKKIVEEEKIVKEESPDKSIPDQDLQTL